MHGPLVNEELVGEALATLGSVPFSPLGRGFLTGKLTADQQFAADDVRTTLPCFTPEALQANQAVVDLGRGLADTHGATPGQVAAMDIELADEKVTALEEAYTPREPTFF